MPDRFKHYWPLSKTCKDDVWKNGVIILDANVYLSLYRFAEQERQELLIVLKNKNILERLWVPHQVADEVFRNRLSVIDEQVVSAKKIINAANKTLTELLNKLDKDIRKHHPLIKRESWQASFETCKNKINQDYKNAQDNYPVSIQNDPYLAEIRGIMNGRIGDAFSEQEMNEAKKDGKYRYDRKIPPGYLDKQKDGDKAYGDYVLWKQILKEMERRKQHTIFVTDDRKVDWWLKKQGQHIGPLAELRQEYFQTTGKEIVFASPAKFQEWGAHIANLEQQSAIQEALEEVARQSPFMRTGFQTVGHGSFNLSPPSKAKRHQNTIDERPTPKEMAEWFLENYKDPANGVPYESKEGGYQYIFGGPYYAHEVIAETFPEANEKDVDKAVDIVSNEGGPEWVLESEY